MSKGKNALVLAGGIPQIDLIRKLQSRGYRTVLADYTTAPVAAPYADEFVCASTLDVDAMRSLAHEISADLIITCCTDQALATVSLLSEEFGLPCYISAEKGTCVTNKRQMKQGMLDHGVPTARPLTMEDCAARNLSASPVVVKPVDCNSSKGVVMIDDVDLLQQAVMDARELSRSNEVIIEEYVPGDEMSVDCFVSNGEGVILCISRSEKIEQESGFVINRGYYTPEYHSENQDRVQAIVNQIVDAFDLQDGPLLIQLIDGPEGLSVVEFSARTGGCVKCRMISRASGVDVIDLTIRASLGEAAYASPVMSDNVIVNDFIYCKPCVLGEITGLDECVESGLIDEYAVLKTYGSEVGGTTNSGDRIVALTTESASVSEYTDRASRFSDHIDAFDQNGTSVVLEEVLKAELA